MLSTKQNVKEHLAVSPDIKAIRVIEKLLNLAISAEADEIFFEPAEDFDVIFRASGEVKDKFSLPMKIAPSILDGLRALARENGGKFKQEFSGYKIIFSLTISSGRFIINLHRENFSLLSLNRLGLSGKNLELVKNNLAKKKGLTLVLGEFNSGRTTTLYSFLHYLSSPGLNLATLENEVIFDLPEINQSRLDPLSGYDFAQGLNSLRRQDIDGAMIAEIIDRETAEAAMHLAAAGHFVMAGLHARDLPAALSFFRDLAIPLSLFSNNARLVIGQSLAEKNCPHCLKERRIGSDSLKRLAAKINLKKLLPRLKRDKIISEKIKNPEGLVFYKSAGCPRCHNSGAAGKIGIFEVLEITPAVKDLIKTGHFSLLRAEAGKQDNYSLVEDALIKSLQGLISLEEFFKVVSI
jgi:type II secretory ATPase GspE/PulE/Tfp pilus assembly ATPase PilB-like protein